MTMNLVLDYTFLIVILGTAIFGFIAGSLGCFAVLRRQSLLGDAISHAALPGVAIAFILTLTKHPLVLLSGAFIAGWIATLLVTQIRKTTRIKEDAALGILLSVFFGTGIFLLTIIQRFPTAEKSGLNTFLFGNAATLLREDILIMSVLGIIALLFLVLFWKEWKLITFDRAFAQSIGLPVAFLDVILLTLIVIAIVIGLQTVGVVLMSAMIIAPAVAARQWTNQLHIMVMLAGIFGSLAGASGAMISSSIAHLPTGPTVVVTISIIVLVSLFFSPQRGLFFDWLRYLRNKTKIRVSRTLYHLYKLSQSHENPYHAHHISSLRAINPTNLEQSLKILQEKGLVTMVEAEKWALTAQGLKEAESLQRGTPS
ncbi:metal ABC transporter permease [Candidatus Woesearchaeota archaeon]|nr:metal ABC transporter permease [Candidatus Woesearchaeota archaeon]